MTDDTLPRPAVGEGPDTPERPDAPRPGQRTLAELLAQARIDLDRVPQRVIEMPGLYVLGLPVTRRRR